MVTVDNILKFEQYRHEFNTWKRTIDFFKQENAFLKNRLSKVVDVKSDKFFLAKAEQYQNQFIIQDEFMDELKHDIHVLDEIVENVENQLLSTKKIETKRTKIHNEMQYLEKNFTSIKNDFNDYLLQNV